MPTYDFSCPNGHEFEHFYRSMSAAPTEMICPECGATAVRRVSGGSGLVFKGSGFYITDYGKDGKKDQRAAQSKAADAKPAEKKSDGGGASSGKSDK
jgi:putative FmdB family regulatory protein